MYLEAVWRELRTALRSLLRAPLATAAMIAILAAGIGLNTAAYSILYGILLRPYPYAAPERLVRIASEPVKAPGTRVGVSLPDFEDFRRDARTVQDLSAWATERINLLSPAGDGAAALPVDAGVISPGLFAMLGAGLALGREFLPEEDLPGGDVNKVILSHALWENRFQGDPGILGKALRTSLGSFTVVGVAAPGFEFPRDSALWIPIESELRARNGSREQRFYRKYRVLGRLRAGTPLQAAADEFRQIGARLQREQARTNSEILPVVEPLRSVETAAMRPYVLLLMGGAGLVLLVCCINLAGLLLARSASRTREFAVRAAIGAGRRRLLLQLLSEYALLAAAGALLGLLLADALLGALPRIIPSQFPFWMHFDLNRNVLAFTCAATLATILVFGLVPLLSSSRADLEALLREGARATLSSARSRRALIVGEVALSAVLLVGAGLLLKSLHRLERVQPGFQPSNVLVLQLSPFRPGPAQQRIQAATDYFRRAIAALAALPGVTAVGASDALPYADAGDRPSYNMEVRGEGAVERSYRGPGNVIDITPRYFDAMGIPLLAGRAFDDRDQPASERVIILSERAAKLLFPGRNPIGGQVRHNTNGMADPWSRVVGVVGNVKYRADEPDGIEMYYPSSQWEFESAYVAIRLQGSPKGYENAVRQAIASVDATTGIDEMKSMDALMEETLWQQRSWGYVLAGFAGATLLLAAVGLYGVLAYSVTLRRTEIGIRAALGAAPRTIFGEVTREGVMLAAAGAGVGLIAALGVMRFLRTMLYGVAPGDLLTFVSAAAILIAVAVLASAVPAVRAARVDPVKILRT